MKTDKVRLDYMSSPACEVTKTRTFNMIFRRFCLLICLDKLGLWRTGLNTMKQIVIRNEN